MLTGLSCLLEMNMLLLMGCKSDTSTNQLAGSSAVLRWFGLENPKMPIRDTYRDLTLSIPQPDDLLGVSANIDVTSCFPRMFLEDPSTSFGKTCVFSLMVSLPRSFVLPWMPKMFNLFRPWTRRGFKHFDFQLW